MEYAILFAVMGTLNIWLYAKYTTERKKFLIVSSMLDDVVMNRVEITRTADGFEIKAKKLHV